MGEKEDEELWDAINTTKMDEARLKKIKTLLSNGADPNWAPKGVYYTGHNSLHWACFGRRGKPVVDLLLASGINDIDQKTGGDEYTALMLACMNGYAEVAALLNAGADPSLTSKKGETAAQMTAGTYWGAKKVAMIEAEIASPGGALRELQAQQAKEEKKERKAEAKRAEQERKAEAKRAEQARVAAQLQDVTSGDMDAIKTIIKNKKKSPAVYSALMSATSDGGVTGDDIAMVATNHGHTALAKLLTKELKLIEKAAAKVQKKANKAAGLGNVSDQQIMDTIVADAKAGKLLPSPALDAFGEKTLRKHMGFKNYAAVASLISSTVQEGGKWDFKLLSADIDAILADKSLLSAYKKAGIDFTAYTVKQKKAKAVADAKAAEVFRVEAEQRNEADLQQQIKDTVQKLEAAESARRASAQQTEDQRRAKAFADEIKHFQLAEVREERKIDYVRAVERAQKVVAQDKNKYQIAFGEFLDADGGKGQRERVALDTLAKDIADACAAKKANGAVIEQPDMPGVDHMTHGSKYIKGLRKTFKKEMAKTDAILATIAAASDAKLHIGDSKSTTRLVQKARLSYNENLKLVTDFERRALEFAAFHGMTEALKMIFRDFIVIRIKNRFDKENTAAKRTGAYRDIQVVCYVKGTKLLFELQLHLTCIYEVKSSVAATKDANNKTGHERYIEFRELKEEADHEYADIRELIERGEGDEVDPEPEHEKRLAALEELNAHFEPREQEAQKAAAAAIRKIKDDDVVRHAAVVAKWAKEKKAFAKTEAGRGDAEEEFAGFSN